MSLRVLNVSVAPRLFGSLVQDKAIKRFIVRNMVETAAHRDLKDASVYEGKTFD
jgi:ribosomal protein S26